MNGKKWTIFALIAVAVLFLVALILGTVLAVKTLRQLDDMEIFGGSDHSGTWQPEDEEAPRKPQSQVVEVAPEAPEGTRLALVLQDVGAFAPAMADAFTEACAQAGVPADIVITGSGDPGEVFETCCMYMASGVSAIATNCPDPDMMAELADLAQEYGVVLVSLDTAMGMQIVPTVSLHIHAFGMPLDYGSQLLYALGDATDRAGSFGLLSSSKEDAVRDFIRENYYSEEYGDLDMTANAEAYEGMEPLKEMAAWLLNENDPDAILCTSPEATLAAAQVIREQGSDVLLFGFCDPEQIADIMPQGLVFYENPRAMGELAVWSMVALLDGTMPTQLEDLLVLPNGKAYDLCEWDGTPTFSVQPVVVDQYAVND